MASAGTLLADLDGKSPVFNKDDDLVNRILADMNTPSQSNPVMNAPPPPSGHSNKMIHAPNPNTTYSAAIDPATATAHIIGKEYPTSADFANMMHSTTYPHGGAMYAPPMNPYQQGQAPMAPPTLSLPAQGNFYNDLFIQLKQPLLVAIILFLINLPVFQVLIGHYLPSLIRIGGDLTMVGLAVKALLGGFLFWFIQKVLVPLMVV